MQSLIKDRRVPVVLTVFGAVLAVVVTPGVVCEVRQLDVQECTRRWEKTFAFLELSLFGGAIGGAAALETKRFPGERRGRGE